MKTKSKNTRPKKKKEFRYHKVVALTKKGKAVPLRHPAFVFYERGNIFIYVSYLNY